MGRIRYNIHRMVLSWMPDSALQFLKKRHYVRAVSQYYESEFDIVRLLLKSGHSAIDIGANAGWYTKLFSDLVGPAGIVYSLEPVPPTYEILVNTVVRLNLINVQHYNYALSDTQGTTTMAIPHYKTGGENYYRSRIIDTPTVNGLRTFNVETTTLDKLMEGRSTEICLVKCDVEGHELKVLGGSKQFLRKTNAAWLIEISEDPDMEGTDADKLFRIFHSHGYEPYIYRNGSLAKRLQGDNSINYFMLKPTHLDSIPNYFYASSYEEVKYR